MLLSPRAVYSIVLFSWQIASFWITCRMTTRNSIRIVTMTTSRRSAGMNHVEFFKNKTKGQRHVRVVNVTERVASAASIDSEKNVTEDSEDVKIEAYFETLINRWREKQENSMTHHIVFHPMSEPVEEKKIQFPPTILMRLNHQQQREPEYDPRYQHKSRKRRSENFEVQTHAQFDFTHVGGFDDIKAELMQVADCIVNYSKYERFNVRTPKGLILEGPPGNGKTMIAKGFAGECNVSFLATSGSIFQDKYVGVGAARVREMYQLARENRPCIIFIDEIDAVGRRRSSESNDGAESNAERDSTLNELLVALDGFNNISGVFTMGATNRADMLDQALLRAGRMDKRIFVGTPDEKTRRAILNIHMRGKPHAENVNLETLVTLTEGLSAAQMETMLNEAMLMALRRNEEMYSMDDVDAVMNRIWGGPWIATEQDMQNATMWQISIHEMGHAILGMLCQNHSKVKKVVLNKQSASTPGYTIFEPPPTIQTRNALFQHLMILLGGRIAEEIVFGDMDISTGASNDLNEATTLAQKMILVYGMGKVEKSVKISSSHFSDKYKTELDQAIIDLMHDAEIKAHEWLTTNKNALVEGARILMEHKTVMPEKLLDIITAHSHVALH